MRPFIAILDFGSQYTHLIARRLRELKVLSFIFSPNVSLSRLKGAKGIILSGGPKSVYKEKIKYNSRIFSLGMPILGLCYGHQLIAHFFRGKVKRGKIREYGETLIQLIKTDGTDIFEGLKKNEIVWMSHGDSVIKVPEGFKIIAKSRDCPVVAMADVVKKIFGFQFHPEVVHTRHGLKILDNFLRICHLEKTWQVESLEKEIIKKIKQQVKNRKVFLLVSGGIDSTVCFALLEKALGQANVYGLHIDTGLMRLNESRLVKDALEKVGFTNLHILDASSRFINALQNVFDPEEKRKIIGRLFIEIADEEIRKLNLKNYLLAQGTIYPDTIESAGTYHADKIKTHHNRIELVERMKKQGKVIEPLVDLYKDEVRALALKLGLPASLVFRRPFPGPGLAIRIICSTGQEKPRQIKGLRVLPIRSVGVQGDERSYKHPAVLQGPLDWSRLNKLSIKITNQCRGINRVLYLLKPKKLSHLILEKTTITKEKLDYLRKIEARVDKITKNIKDIWQFPIVLLPFGKAIVLRPVASQEAMTANFYPLSKKILRGLVKALDFVDHIFYDITNKPPATIEWE